MRKIIIEKMTDGKFLGRKEDDWGDVEYLTSGDTAEDVCLAIADHSPVKKVEPEEVAAAIVILTRYEDDRGYKAIDGIKAIRTICDCGLKEAKEAFDKARDVDIRARS